jgi:hypothetical protein
VIGVADERIWLRHPETGGYFHCPAEAVEHWTELGYEPSDAPPEVNPVVAERVAQEQELAAQAAARAAQAAEEPTTRKPRAGAGSSPEGSDHGA